MILSLILFGCAFSILLAGVHHRSDAKMQRQIDAWSGAECSPSLEKDERRGANECAQDF